MELESLEFERTLGEYSDVTTLTNEVGYKVGCL
jgi:hypothetical protein